MLRAAPLLLLVSPLLVSPACFGYISQFTATAQPVPLMRVDNTAIQFYMNDLIVPGVRSSASGSNVTVVSADSNPQQAVRAALAAWNAVGTANVHFLPLQLTSKSINVDFQMTIAIGSTASDLSVVGGALGFTVDTYAIGPSNMQNGQLVVCSSNCTYQAGSIFDSDIILNPGKPFSTTRAAGTFDLRALMTHELGHSLGANHTGLLGATMFQFPSTPIARQLSSDDITYVNATYPSVTSPVAFGVIGGKVGIAGTAGSALLTVVNTVTGATIGGITNGDGTYSLRVPVGTYQMYAEPLNGVVQPQNIFLPGLAAGSLQSTLFTGTVNVTANATTTANVTAAGSTSAFAVPDVAFTTVGGTVSVPFAVGGPLFVPSGQSVDMLFAGAGFDGSLSDANFTILGQGVSIPAGGVRLDPGGQTFGAFPILRVTLAVAAQQSLSLASVFVTKGSSTLSLSGALVIGPPTPVFTSEGVLSAASGLGNGAGNGAVSPGEYVALYGSPGLGPTGGPTFGGFPNAGYDVYGLLAAELAGVSVAFDGVAAPIFYVNGDLPGSSPGYAQINLQVPFEVAGKVGGTTQIVVNYLGSISSAVAVPVLASHPAFFTVGATTAAYLQNVDLSVNTAANPAARGTEITVYGTGDGVVNPAAVTGEGAPIPSTFSANGFSCTVGGVNATVRFAGWTPTLVALAQWNIVIPSESSLAATGAVSIVCTDGAASTQSTQPTLTVFVK